MQKFLLFGTDVMFIGYWVSDKFRFSFSSELTKLKTLCLHEFSDLSGVEYSTNLERIEIYSSVFSEIFVFDNETSVTEFKFRDCVFEKGILFKNDSVENVTFEDCGVMMLFLRIVMDW